MGLLFKFARKMNELDFAASLMQESRGSQDAGWSITITADQVFNELKASITKSSDYKLHEISVILFRVILLLYCQLSEAGGVYESLKNMMGVVQDESFLLWPFKDLVRVKEKPKRVIGPNANATFRGLAQHATAIGVPHLSDILAQVFRDDVRNAMFHSDYILWEDGLRLRKRNGGNADRIDYESLFQIISVGISFYQTINELTLQSMNSFDPPRKIVGKFSANPPMPMTVGYEPTNGAFSISGSSPGHSTSLECIRQEIINELLGGHILAVFRDVENSETYEFGFLEYGFAPVEVDLSKSQYHEIVTKIEHEKLYDSRLETINAERLLTLSHWGFCKVTCIADIEILVGEPEIFIVFRKPEM